jgi:hypothetical protein
MRQMNRIHCDKNCRAFQITHACWHKLSLTPDNKYRIAHKLYNKLKARPIIPAYLLKKFVGIFLVALYEEDGIDELLFALNSEIELDRRIEEAFDVIYSLKT